MGILTSLPATIERHELKYAIPWRQVDSLRRFLEVYCELDHHSTLAPDNFYRINSLYLDTRGLEFLRQRIYGKDGRFNMRVRCYGEQGDAPYFLEIKRKSGTTGKKYRSVATAAEWPAIVQDPGFHIDQHDDSKECSNKRMFLRLATTYAIEPKLLTQYRRCAYVSSVDDYARVTLDVDMKYRLQDHYSLVGGDGMINYDNETIYARDMFTDGVVILELKSNIGQVPTWMLDLISTFDLKQQGFSKYMSSYLVSHLEDGLSYMGGDRQVTQFGF